MDSIVPGAHALAQDGTPAPNERAHRAVPSSAGWRIWNWCQGALRDFSYLVLPGECAVCGAEDQGLCLQCAGDLRRATAAPFRAESTADALMGVTGDAHLAVTAGGIYRDVLAAAILAYKNHGRTELGPHLARCLARSLQGALSDRAASTPPGAAPRPAWVPGAPRTSAESLVLLVPIPSSGAGWRRRGIDPVGRLLKIMAREGRLPAGVVIAPLLGSRATWPWRRRHQKALGRSARRTNVHNSMRIRPRVARKFLLTAKPSGQLVVVIDDVLTTGSTLREAKKTLASWGYLAEKAVVLAATRAPDHDRPGSGT